MKDKQLYWDETRGQQYWIEWEETGNNDIPHRHYIVPNPTKDASIEFRPNMDEIDEIVANNCHIHLEYMDDTDIWMGIDKGEETYHVHIQTKKAHIKTWAEKCLQAASTVRNKTGGQNDRNNNRI